MTVIIRLISTTIFNNEWTGRRTLLPPPTKNVPTGDQITKGTALFFLEKNPTTENQKGPRLMPRRVLGVVNTRDYRVPVSLVVHQHPSPKGTNIVGIRCRTPIRFCILTRISIPNTALLLATRAIRTPIRITFIILHRPPVRITRIPMGVRIHKVRVRLRLSGRSRAVLRFRPLTRVQEGRWAVRPRYRCRLHRRHISIGSIRNL